jgi:hypothetical protein
MGPSPKSLRILLVRRPCCLWVARLVEHDIAVEGATADAAADALMRFVLAHIDFDRRHRRPPLSAFAPPPRYFSDMFGWATSLRTVRLRADEEAIDVRVSVAQDWTTNPALPTPLPN